MGVGVGGARWRWRTADAADPVFCLFALALEAGALAAKLSKPLAGPGVALVLLD